METLNRKYQKDNVHIHRLKSKYSDDQCSNKLQNRSNFHYSFYQYSQQNKIDLFSIFELQRKRTEVEWI